tara:strand:+ start:3314 stop:4024 length:711 start_codon:yes stop_codon:yes gene_type:complete
MNNLILVRHGQSLWNKEKRFTGWVDIDLTEQGKLEAKRSGELIKELNIEFHAYFTSELKRATNSLNIILKILNKSDAKIIKAWELNERHYGNLTSLNKDQVIKEHGAKQVEIWRRSFDIPPPAMNSNHPYVNKILSNDKIVKIPKSESLKNTYERVVPYYQKEIEPLISSKKNILVVFHGNSCRSLLKKIFNISEKKIIDFEIPTGNPLLIKFNNSKIVEYKYLDFKRAKKILFNI